MTIKEIEKEYKIFKFKKRIYIYDKIEGSGKRMPNKYLCEIKRETDKRFSLNGISFNSFKLLEKEILSFLAGLPYDSEYYNPIYREGVFEYHIIHDYMISLGAKNDFKDIYKFHLGGIYSGNNNIAVSFNYLEYSEMEKKSFKGKVNINILINNSCWITTEVDRNVESIKIGIDAILKPYLLSISGNCIKIAEKLKNKAAEISKIGIKENNILDLHSQKLKLKKELTELLKSLE